MQEILKSNKRVIVSVIMALMLIASMMPGMAFATTVVDGYDVEITSAPETAPIGTDTYVVAEITQQVAGETVHIDYSIENTATDTGSATIGKHNGKLVGNTAGTVTVKATLKTGAGTGGTGDGSGGALCEGTELAYDTVQVTVPSNTEYGFQGDSGNTMKLTVPSFVSYLNTTTRTVDGTTYNVYNNKITRPVGITTVQDEDGTVTEQYCTFAYTMSAGINNFNEDTFAYYQDAIKVLNTDGSETNAQVTLDDFDSASRNVYIKVSNLSAGNYILQFGPKVCGNNYNKKLGAYVEFAFTAN